MLHARAGARTLIAASLTISRVDLFFFFKKMKRIRVDSNDRDDRAAADDVTLLLYCNYLL